MINAELSCVISEQPICFKCAGFRPEGARNQAAVVGHLMLFTNMFVIGMGAAEAQFLN